MSALPLVPLLPAVAALVWALLGRQLGGRLTARLATGAVGATFLLALSAARNLEVGAPPVALYTWIAVDTFRADAALLLDPLSAVMIVVVTGIGFLIHLYSIGYMAEEKDQARYFSYLNLFTAAMLVLVLADNLLVMFVGWEGVGLCSYLLIGFWYERKAAADAAKKAFIVNRIGDFGFLLGILLTFVTFGSIRFSEFLPRVAEHQGAVLTGIALLLFWGATGKSAQLPLYVWLPDAMEGPTPVSALIHAATMVTAGVYLVVRTSPLFAASETALAVVGGVGAATAIFAATIALVQDDLKRVLAYSTISQLGYMFMACGVAAFSAAIFHLVTHAFFKALLFLGAGSVMHALGGETNIRKMGGLRAALPVTAATSWVGGVALAGGPPFSGFFSKDEILWAAFRKGHYVLVFLGILGALLTAFYVARLWYLVFQGDFRGDPKHKPHESPRVMLIPLIVLALGAAAAGLLGLPHASFIEHYIASSVAGPLAEAGGIGKGSVILLSVLMMALGFLTARRFYSSEPERPEKLVSRARGLYTLVRDKYRVDELYDAVIVRPVDGLSRVLLWRVVDVAIVDGLVNLVGRVIVVVGEVLRLVQSGNARVYLFFVLAGTAAMFSWFFLK